MRYVLSSSSAQKVKALIERGPGGQTPHSSRKFDDVIESPAYAPFFAVQSFRASTSGSSSNTSPGWYIKYASGAVVGSAEIVDAVDDYITGLQTADHEADDGAAWYAIPSEVFAPESEATTLWLTLTKTSSSGGDTWEASFADEEGEADIAIPIAYADTAGLPEGGVRVTQRHEGVLTISTGTGGGGGGEGVEVDVVASIDGITVDSISGGAFVLRINYTKKSLKVVEDATATAATADIALMSHAVVSNSTYSPSTGDFKQVKRTFVMLPTVGADSETTVFTATPHPPEP